jgi:uncharacterized membrane protein YkoI
MTKTLSRLLFLVAGTLFLAGLSLADDKNPPKKSNLVEVDLSKLPPDVARKLQEFLQQSAKEPYKDKGKGKGKPKAPEPAPLPTEKPKPSEPAPPPKEKAKPTVARNITLVEAITLAEKSGKGTATKAERKGEGSETFYRIEVTGSDGKKTRIELTLQGKVRDKRDDD